jgi:soluble lytic murein transglycosylase-like protein
LFNPETHDAVVRTQRLLQIADDGQVGKVTMKAMLIPIIKATAKQTGCPWEVAVGILQNEGGWDPGAVGRVDPEDWGLAQISHKAHPTLAFSDAYCPSYAVRFVCGTIGKRLRTFDGNIRDAIASYNLGEGGARTWIKAGRPDEWTTGAIHMNKYIDRILNAV